MTWDPSSSRLAVVLDASAPRRDDDGGAREPGRVALYATTTRPVVRASLLGYVSAPGVRDVGMRLGVGGPARAVAMAGPGGGRGGGGGDGGEEASSTLAVCWEGGGVSVCPLYFPR
jgi:aladin